MVDVKNSLERFVGVKVDLFEVFGGVFVLFVMPFIGSLGGQLVMVVAVVCALAFIGAGRADPDRAVLRQGLDAVFGFGQARDGCEVGGSGCREGVTVTVQVGGDSSS